MPNEINQNDIIYYFKRNTSRKRFDDFNNGIGLSKKIKSARTKLGEEKKLQNVFELNRNEIWRRKYKS